MLKIVDERWMEHIDAMDELKDGIRLQSYGQKDPVVQYRIEGFDMFDQMVADIQLNVIKILKMCIRDRLLVTHDEKIALQADRIIKLKDGKIIQDEQN